MNQTAGLFLVVFVLAALVAGVRQCARPLADEGATRPMLAYNAEIERFSQVDPALVLYREVAPVIPVGLEALTAVAVGEDGRIYAGGGSQVVVLSAAGERLHRFSVDGTVTALAPDGTHTLYVAVGATVLVYETGGLYRGALEGLPEDAHVTALAVLADGVFVADAQARAIHRFTPDREGMRTFDGRLPGDAASGFLVPSPYFDILPGQGGTLWVVNPGRHRLEEYNGMGERIATWPDRPGMAIEAFSGCCNPTHVARLSDGTMVTAEKGLPRVKVYSRRGQFRGVVATPEQFDERNAGYALAVDARDRILVADPVRRQIRVFEAREEDR